MSQSADRGVGGIQLVGVGAVGIQGQPAVSAVYLDTDSPGDISSAAVSGLNAGHSHAVGTCTVIFHNLARQGGGSLVHAGRVIPGCGNIVYNAHSQYAISGDIGLVRDGQADLVSTFRARAPMRLGRLQNIGVTQPGGRERVGGAGHIAQAGQTQFALTRIDDIRRRTGGQGGQFRRRESPPGNGHLLQSVGSVQFDNARGGSGLSGRTIGCQAGLVHISLTISPTVAVNRRDGRRPIRLAYDGDGQLRRIRLPFRIGQSVREGFGEVLPFSQEIDLRIAVVQRVDIGAVGTDFQRAVTTGNLRSRPACRSSGHGSHGSALSFRSRADACHNQLGAGAFRVGILPDGAGLDISVNRGRILFDGIGVVHGHRRIVHRCNTGIDDHRVGGVGINGCPPGVRSAHIHSISRSGHSPARLDEPGGEPGRRTIPVGLGQEAYLGVGLKHQPAGCGNSGNGCPGIAVVTGILPHTLGGGLIGHTHDHNPVKRVGIAAAMSGLVILRIPEFSRDQIADGLAHWFRRVLIDGGQNNRIGVRSGRGVIHRVNGDVYSSRDGLGAAGAYIALIVESRRERHRICAVVVGIGCVPEGCQSRIVIGQRAGQRHGPRIIGPAGNHRAGQIADGNLARRHGDGDRIIGA